MTTEYAGSSVFHTAVTDVADTEFISHDSLYVRGIRKLRDGSIWLRDEIVRRAAALASATAGTAGTVTGSVDLTTLTYDPTTGTLNGLTFQIQSNNSGLKTVTFGTGAGLAPANGADVVSQINTATGSNPLARIDSAGHLSIASTTTGGTGTITIQGGGAVTLLGFTVSQTATGLSSGGDGVSLVGLAAITGSSFNLSTGTLRAALQSIADNAARALPTNTIFGTLGASVTRTAAGFAQPYSGTWTLQATGNYATAVATVCVLNIALGSNELPNGVTLTGVAVTLSPPAHASIAGLTLPTLALFSYDSVAGLVQIGATTPDPSLTFTAYSAVHTIPITGLSTVIDRTTKRYFLQVTSEFGGGNAASALLVSGANVVYTGL